jgi:hypothetical protein
MGHDSKQGARVKAMSVADSSSKPCRPSTYDVGSDGNTRRIAVALTNLYPWVRCRGVKCWTTTYH